MSRVGLAALVTTMGVLVVAAPGATAAVTSLHAEPGASYGTAQYGTGCSYSLIAQVDTVQLVSFYDYDTTSRFQPGNLVRPVNGVARVTWTPSRPGLHRIVAYQTSAGGPSVYLRVGTGVNTGSACLVLP